MLVAAIIIIRYLLDDSIHTEDYLTDNYPDVPLLAVIPDLNDTRSNGYGYSRYGHYGAAARTASGSDNNGRKGA